MKNNSQIIYILILVALTSIFLVAEKASAEEQSQYTEVARERRYVGGADESDLKVQANTTAAAKNKAAPAQESNEGF